MATATPEAALEAKFENLIGSDDPEPQTSDADEIEEGSEASSEEQAESQSKQAETAALEEVEIDGKVEKVSAAVKSALMRTADYTRKTQEVAEERKLVQLERQAQGLDAEFRKSSAAEFKALSDADAKLQQFDDFDWRTQSGDALLQLKIAYDKAKETREKAESAIKSKRGEFDGKLDKLKADLISQGNKILAQALPKWDAKTAQDLKDYAIREGFSSEEMSNIYDPRFVKLMFKAQQYDTLQSSKSGALAKAAKAPPLTKPGTTSPETQKAMDRTSFRKAMKTASPNKQVALVADRLAKFIR